MARPLCSNSVTLLIDRSTIVGAGSGEQHPWNIPLRFWLKFYQKSKHTEHSCGCIFNCDDVRVRPGGVALLLTCVLPSLQCRQWLQQLSRVGVVAGKAKVTCPLCGKVCSRSDKLKLHLRTHTGERPYLCTYCDHRSRTSDDLKRHVRTHTGERPYQCPFCPYRASDPSTIRSHKKHRHHDLFHQARLAAQQQQDQSNG